MAIRLSEVDIRRLMIERKPLPPDFRDRIQVKPKRGHKERELDITGADGSEFRLILRQSTLNPLDFSVILAYRMPESNQLFRLRRYNGRSHEHTNTLEGETFFAFHIHMATERYQDQSGLREDAFAVPTDRFADLHGALRCLQEDCGLVLPASSQPSLFEEM